MPITLCKQSRWTRTASTPESRIKRVSGDGAQTNAWSVNASATPIHRLKLRTAQAPHEDIFSFGFSQMPHNSISDSLQKRLDKVVRKPPPLVSLLNLIEQ